MNDIPEKIGSVGITGVVLAGGLGRRMGGVDKGLQPLRGKPLIAWVLARFAPQVDDLLINANRNTEAHAALGFPVVADALPDFPGPLAGLHAALTHAHQPLVATVPCDSPFLPEDYVARMRTALLASEADLALANAGGRIHPVFCLCRRELLADLDACLAAGERRFQTWCRHQRHVEVAFDDRPEAFANINPLDDLARLA